MGQAFRGIGVSGGIAIGRVHLVHAPALPEVAEPVPPERVEQEIEEFHAAREAARAELEELRDQVRRALGEPYVGILDAQRLILDDPALIAETTQRIRVGRVSSRWALREAVAEFTRRFDRVTDDYIRERGGELDDVHRRLQRILRRFAGTDDRVAEGPLIAVSHALGPSDAVQLARAHVVGLATDVGGRTSHTAILAQALALPAVVGLHDFSRSVREGDAVILDGDNGIVLLEPGARETAEAVERRGARLVAESEMESSRELPAVTTDGTEIALRANIEFPSELDAALRFGAHGIGLYRSEFLFLSRAPRLPTEAEHFETCVAIASRVAPHPVNLRTLDLGGEKYFHEILEHDDPNPVLGLRGVRFCLKRPDVFRPQLRGLLRAAAVRDNVRVLLPLVTVADEVRAVRALLAEEAERLALEGSPVRRDVPVGIMIEVPAAAMAADVLAREADFLSIGTNDLAQYALAVDRGNESLADLYQPFHPGLLRMIRHVVEAGKHAGVPVGICGEMAADPEAVSILLGLGLRELSVQPRAVGSVRRAVRQTALAGARRGAEAALAGGPAAFRPGALRGILDRVTKTGSPVERVDKPWGYELRFAHTDRYAGKLLFIRAGQQLSLQYHVRKDESLWLQDGTMELVLGCGRDQRVELLEAGSARRILPGTVHRFRAVTDCLLFEVSSPELEDVVRLEDDYGREGTTDSPAETSGGA